MIPPDELARLAEQAFLEAMAHFRENRPDRALDRFTFASNQYGQVLAYITAQQQQPPPSLLQRLGQCGIGVASCLRLFRDPAWRGPLVEAGRYLRDALRLNPTDPDARAALDQITGLAALPDGPTAPGIAQPFNPHRAKLLVSAANAAYAPVEGAFNFTDSDLGHLGCVLETDTDVVVAYRGSIVPRGSHSKAELMTSGNDWFGVNFNFAQVPGLGGRVHRGFLERLDRSWRQVLGRVGGNLRGRSLWVTGHSMGGALSILAGQRFAEAGLPPTGVYAFGAPKVGDEAFKAGYRPPLFCVDNRHDVVPWLPLSRWVRDVLPAGRFRDLLQTYFSDNDYARVGEEWWITPNGDLRQPTFMDRTVYRLGALVGRPDRWIPDHWIEQYIEFLDRY